MGKAGSSPLTSILVTENIPSIPVLHPPSPSSGTSPRRRSRWTGRSAGTKSCFYYTNRISFDEFLNISDNIISTSACLASPLNKLPDDHPRYMELAKKYTFLEVQAHHHPDQVAFNRRLLELSKKIGTPLIAGTDTHSSSQYKAECRSILMSAKHR